MNCPFCEMVSGNKERVIKESTLCFVALSDPKLMPGHLLVIPKRHVEKFSELDPSEAREVFNEAIRLQEKILEKVAPGCDISQHYRPFIPDNKFKVSHLHIHIRPRFLDDELYMKVQAFEKDVFTRADLEDVQKYKDIIKD